VYLKIKSLFQMHEISEHSPYKSFIDTTYFGVKGLFFLKLKWSGLLKLKLSNLWS